MVDQEDEALRIATNAYCDAIDRAIREYGARERAKAIEAVGCSWEADLRQRLERAEARAEKAEAALEAAKSYGDQRCQEVLELCNQQNERNKERADAAEARAQKAEEERDRWQEFRVMGQDDEESMVSLHQLELAEGRVERKDLGKTVERVSGERDSLRAALEGAKAERARIETSRDNWFRCANERWDFGQKVLAERDSLRAALEAAKAETVRMAEDHHALGKWPKCAKCAQYFADDQRMAHENGEMQAALAEEKRGHEETKAKWEADRRWPQAEMVARLRAAEQEWAFVCTALEGRLRASEQQASWEDVDNIIGHARIYCLYCSSQSKDAHRIGCERPTQEEKP